MNAAKYIRIAKALARVMTPHKTLDITVSGNQAYCVGDRINLPAGDYSDPDFCRMVQGWIDHELGHVKHTDLGLFENAARTCALLKDVLNIVEDVWMEKRVGNEFPGAKSNLLRLCELAVEKGLFIEPDQSGEPIREVFKLCLYYARSFELNHICLNDYTSKALGVVESLINRPFVEAICKELDSISNSTQTADNLKIAENIVSLIADKMDVSNYKSNQPDFHEQLANMLSNEADNFISSSEYEGGGVAVSTLSTMVNTKKPYKYSCELVENKAITSRIFQTIQKVIVDNVQNFPSHKDKGSRLISKRLSGIPTGNFSVFTDKIIQQDVSCAVSVLVDASGSMKHGKPIKMDVVNTCALSLAKALSRNNIAVSVSYFGVYSDEHRNAYYDALPFGGSIKAGCFNVIADGCTPTGEAMYTALMPLACRDEQKKFMFVLTDGDPDCLTSVIRARDAAKLLGIKVIPIGVHTNRVHGFTDDEFVSIQTAEQLSEAMKQAVAKGLF